MEPVVDLIGINGQVTGEVAGTFARNGQLNLGALRPFIGTDGRAYMTVYKGGDPTLKSNYANIPLNTNATLRRDEWKQLDDVVLEASRQRLGGIEDLTSKNLVFNLGNAMGTTMLEWHDVNDGLEAAVSMDGVTRTKGGRPKFQHNYLPIPIIHVDYEINARVLAASRSLGNPLDTTNAERAARRVQEKLEAMLFTDTTYNFGEKDSRGRNTIYSYVNHPDRNPVTLKVGWAESGITPALILKDVQAMKAASIAAKHYGPWMLYVPTEYETVLDEDYATDGTNTTTIRERILKLNGIQGIKVSDMLAANNVVLVQMTSDTVRLVRGLGLQNVEWETEGKFITKYKVLTIQVPQIRSDQDGNSGIVHLA